MAKKNLYLIPCLAWLASLSKTAERFHYMDTHFKQLMNAFQFLFVHPC